MVRGSNEQTRTDQLTGSFEYAATMIADPIDSATASASASGRRTGALPPAESMLETLTLSTWLLIASRLSNDHRPSDRGLMT